MNASTSAEIGAPRDTDAGVRPGLARLLELWPDTVAFVHDSDLTVIAATALARALHPAFQVGANLLRYLFLDEASHSIHRDWPAVARQAVANLHSTTDSRSSNVSTTRLIGELSLKSEPFRRLWASGHRYVRRSGTLRLDLPLLGTIELHYEQLAVDNSSGQQLLIFQPEPHTASEHALRFLTSMSAAAHSDTEKGTE